MSKSIVTYETFHGSAKKIANVVADKIGCKCINIDTPFEAEDLRNVDNIILVFNFRGPYTAQLTKLYLDRVKDQLKNRNVILIGEGLFSEKEFPIVADDIHKSHPSRTFKKFFVDGQLRTDSLYPEERVMLAEFSRLTGMDIVDMGELNLTKANQVADEIYELVNSDEYTIKEDNSMNETKWVCTVCGYVHTGENPPERCPLCKVPADKFVKKD